MLATCANVGETAIFKKYFALYIDLGVFTMENQEHGKRKMTFEVMALNVLGEDMNKYMAELQKINWLLR